MKSCIILYSSLAQHTKHVSLYIENFLIEKKFLVQNLFLQKDQDLSFLEKCPFFLLGSSTWVDGELTPAWLSVEKQLRELNLRDSSYAVFGTGQYRYGPLFCQALEILDTHLNNAQAYRLNAPLKLDTSTGIDYSQVSQWLKKIVALVQNDCP